MHWFPSVISKLFCYFNNRGGPSRDSGAFHIRLGETQLSGKSGTHRMRRLRGAAAWRSDDVTGEQARAGSCDAEIQTSCQICALCPSWFPSSCLRRPSQHLPRASVQVGRAGPAPLGLSGGRCGRNPAFVGAFTLSHRSRGNRVSRGQRALCFLLFCSVFGHNSCRKPGLDHLQKLALMIRYAW